LTFTRVRSGGSNVVVPDVQVSNVGSPDPFAKKQLPESALDTHPALVKLSPAGFVQYCNRGSGLMVSDPGGTLYYLNPDTLEVLHATPLNIPLVPAPEFRRVSEKVVCSENSPRAMIVAYGGFFRSGGRSPDASTYYGYGNGLIRVYDLSSGTLVREWDMTESPYDLGDIAISPSGNQIAVSHIPRNPPTTTKKSRPGVKTKEINDIELYDVSSGKMTLQVNPGHEPGRISFAGEQRIASDDTRMPQPIYPHPTIRLWDCNDGKLLREFSDPKVGARRFVGASSDGSVILGYIPRETLHTGWGGPLSETLEQRFRLWDAATGQVIATSPSFLPNLNTFSDKGREVLDPSLELSADGQSVIVFWKPEWMETFPIYVFSEVPAGTTPTTH
jgi:hypothetical protein